MSEIEIRALEQNASAVVAEAGAGATVTITDRGRLVTRLTPIPTSPLRALLEAGHARPARRRLRDLGPPTAGPSLSEELRSMRDDERS